MKYLSCLTPAEEKIIIYRFVLHRNNDDISCLMEITKERVRRIEAKALRKMRHYKNKKNVLEEIEGIDFFKHYDKQAIFQVIGI